MRLKLCFSLLIVSLLLSASPVWAAVYKWTDDQGKKHFTDNKSNIPLQYRTPGRMERPRGMIEPPAPKKEEVPVEEVKNPNEIETPGETAETGPPLAEAEAKAKEEAGLKLKAMLDETEAFLKKENLVHQRLINSVKSDKPNRKFYEFFVKAIQKNLNSKKELAQKLKDFKLSSLKKVKRFLDRSVKLDEKEQLDGKDYQGRIVGLKERLEKGIKTKMGFIKLLGAERTLMAKAAQ